MLPWNLSIEKTSHEDFVVKWIWILRDSVCLLEDLVVVGRTSYSKLPILVNIGSANVNHVTK
jgi:hypothetical protein